MFSFYIVIQHLSFSMTWYKGYLCSLPLIQLIRIFKQNQIVRTLELKKKVICTKPINCFFTKIILTLGNNFLDKFDQRCLWRQCLLQCISVHTQPLKHCHWIQLSVACHTLTSGLFCCHGNCLQKMSLHPKKKGNSPTLLCIYIFYSQ